jgi:GAF domain-containing protein
VKLSESLLLQEMVTTGLPLSVPDVRHDERFPSLVEHKYFSWLGIPLLSKGEVIGVLAMEKSEADFYQPESIQAMVMFAGQASVALENARLYEESLGRAEAMDQRSRRLALLNRLSTELSESLDLERILTSASTELAQALPLGYVSMVVFDEAGQASVGFEKPQLSKLLPEVLPEGAIFERLRQSLGVFSSENISAEPELDHLLPYLARFETRSLFILPLISGASCLTAMVLSSTHLFSRRNGTWFDDCQPGCGSYPKRALIPAGANLHI